MATVKKSSKTKTGPAPITVEFELDRETKNTYRFAETVEQDETPVIGTLYVQKSAFDGAAPESLTVMISVS